ncbi:MAG: hypothetical protein ABI758_00355 [Candidatus Woesebacteria bacterium]
MLLVSLGVGASNLDRDLNPPNISDEDSPPENLFDQLQTSMPESISPDRLSKLHHTNEAIILHLPDTLSGSYGELAGYQPKAFIGPNGYHFESYSQHPFDNVEIVANIDDVDYTAKDTEFVYMPTKINPILYPLDGSRITKIIQEGGTAPKIGGSGELYFSANALPTYVIIIAESQNAPHIYGSNGGVTENFAETGIHYASWVGWEDTRTRALELNAQLAGDPALQRMHADLVHRFDTAIRDSHTQHLTAVELADKLSEIVTDAATSFSDYLSTNRYYSLKFGENNYSLIGYDLLKSVASNPDKGYFCAVGNTAYQQFMKSVGIEVILRPGANEYIYNGHLLSRILHENSMTLLPNGHVLQTDMTPSRPMPGEDLSALTETQPRQNEGNTDLEGEKRIAAERLALMSVGIAGIGLAVSHRKIREKLRRKTLEEKITHSLPDDESVVAHIVSATEHALLYLSEASNEDGWEKLQHTGRYSSREEFYTSLANDAIQLLTRAVPENASNQDTDSESDIKRVQRRLDTFSQTQTSDMRSELQTGLLHVHSQLSEAVKRKRKALEQEHSILTQQLKRLDGNIFHSLTRRIRGGEDPEIEAKTSKEKNRIEVLIAQNLEQRERLSYSRNLAQVLRTIQERL